MMAQAGPSRPQQYGLLREGILGKYECFLYSGTDQNGYHFVEITESPNNDGSFIWKNLCTSWRLIPTEKPFIFEVDKECPYYETYKEMCFHIEQNMVLYAYGPGNEIFQKVRNFGDNLLNMKAYKKLNPNTTSNDTSVMENKETEGCGGGVATTNNGSTRNGINGPNEDPNASNAFGGLSLNVSGVSGVSSEPVFYFSGPGKCKRNQCIGRVCVNDNFLIEFNMFINGKTSKGWESILHIGNTDQERSPGFWLHPNSYKLHVRLSDTDNWNTGYDPNILLEKGEQYNIRLLSINGTVELYINGKVKVTKHDVIHNTRYKVPIWLGNRWHDPANVTVSQLKIYGS